METVHPRIVEPYNPRAMILGACFVCGMAAGFFLYLFRAPEPPPEPPPAARAAGQVSPDRPEPADRRREGVPDITSVEANPIQTAALRPPALESLEIPAPAALLTTEGGLTGLTAKSPAPTTRPETAAPAAGSRTPGAAGPPPLPDLMP